MSPDFFTPYIVAVVRDPVPIPTNVAKVITGPRCCGMKAAIVSLDGINRRIEKIYTYRYRINYYETISSRRGNFVES